MGSKQSKPNLSNIGPRVSVFDKRGQSNLSRLTRISNMPQKSERVSIPTVRINQHKGA